MNIGRSICVQASTAKVTFFQTFKERFEHWMCLYIVGYIVFYTVNCCATLVFVV